MMTIDEYILKRKNEDNISEFDFSKKQSNLKLCVDYVFEYFNGYLDMTEIELQKEMEGKKLAKYRETLKDFSKELQDWLVKIYDIHKCQFNRKINNILDSDELFLLYDSDAEFNKLSYKCYSELIKKNPFLENEIDNLNKYIREYHFNKQNEEIYYFDFKNVDEIKTWVDKVRDKYGINLMAFVIEYCDIFSASPEKWDKSTYLDPLTKTTKWYDHKKSKNLLGINSLYPKISNKPYINGKKQKLLTLLMLYYFNRIDSDEEFFEKYIDSLNKSMEK